MKNKNFHLYLFVICATLFACGYDQTKMEHQAIISQDTVNIPELTIINRRVELGNVAKNTTVTGKYYFKNTGKNKLIIEFVNPDCTCTGFYLEKKEINPGDSSFLVLKMSTKDKEGDVQINATISANTPIHLYKVSLLAKVI